MAIPQMKLQQLVLPILALFVLIAPVLYSQRSEPSSIHALQVAESPALDGMLTEGCWEKAQRISNFQMRDPDPGKPVSERTEVAIVYTSDALYIGIWAFDKNPDGIIANKMARDFSWGNEDNFEIIIDPYNDDRNGYLFVINPNGAKADALVADNGKKFNGAWDGIWDVKTTVNDLGWFAEIELPYSTLRTPNKKEQVWGINFERNIRRKLETAMWQGWSRDDNLERISNAGTLTGISTIRTGNYVDLRPYATAGIEKKRSEESITLGDVGLDANYLISPTVRLSVTVNPDFAQVEDDEVRINLSRYPLYFPEKRKFFLEGQEFYDFRMGADTEPFYSRRIGLSDKRKEVPIVAGARVLAKTNGTAIGAMTMQTAKAGGAESTNYSAVRVKQDIFDESYVGFLAVNKYDQGEVNTTYAGDFKYTNSELFGDKNFGLGVMLAQSFTSDAENKHGGAQRIYMEYPNDFIHWYGVASRVGKNFNPESGFLRRTSFRTYYTRLDINPRPDKIIPFIRRINIRPLEVDYYEDDVTGQIENMTATWRPLGISFTSGEYLRFDVMRYAERIPEPFEIDEKLIIDPDTYWYTQYEVEFQTFEAREFSGSIEYAWGDFYRNLATSIQLDATWRTSKYLALSADFEHKEISLDPGLIIRQAAGGRVTFALSPALFGSVFAQWEREEEELLLNFRVNWIPNPGSDLYFVINQRWAKDAGIFLLNDTVILSKIVWRFEV
jgi:uncharacterized protein DUF5916